MVAVEPIPLDPGDLPSFYAEASARSGRDRSLSLREIALGPDALDRLRPALREAQGRRRAVIVGDDVPMRRAGADLKPLVRGLVAAEFDEICDVVLSAPGGLHTTTGAVAELAGRLRPGDLLVSVGSGTITDITKHAAHTVEAEQGVRLHHIAVATANSVGAYTSQMAVVTTDGVKRTVASRLPDLLILDTTILAGTPADIATGGVGDAAVGWSSLADYRLANLCGLGGFEPLSPAVFLPPLRAFIEAGPALRAGTGRAADLMARSLAAAGFAMSFAGESAPASGLEHVTSHMLDMVAGANGRTIGNHGEQCGLATALVLLVYRHLLDEFDPGAVTPEPVDLAAARQEVAAVFDPIDPTGRMTRECWSDFSAKAGAWNDHLGQVRAVLRDWRDVAAELDSMLADPRAYLSALAAAGHPLHVEQIPPGLTAAETRWAFRNARLMRKRLSVADFMAFLGLWSDELVDTVLAEFAELRDDLSR